jgi:hypothetical protein
MTCTAYEEMAALQQGGDLSAPEAARLSRHLTDCPDCRRFAQSLQESRAAMQRWQEKAPRQELLGEMHLRIMQQISQTEKRTSLRGHLASLIPWPLSLSSSIRLAAALAVLVLVVAVLWRLQFRATEKAELGHVNPPTTLIARTMAPAAPPVTMASIAAQPHPAPALPPADPRRNSSPASRPAALPERAAALLPPDPAPISSGVHPEAILRRIELQTADPNIRIIWLPPQPSRPAKTPVSAIG